MIQEQRYSHLRVVYIRWNMQWKQYHMPVLVSVFLLQMVSSLPPKNETFINYSTMRLTRSFHIVVKLQTFYNISEVSHNRRLF